MQNKNYLIPLGFAICLALGVWFGNVTGSKFAPATQGGGVSSAKYEKMRDIISIIDQRYVDTVNGEQLFEQAISDMLHNLDPHSNYIAAEDLEAAREQIDGEFGGVGVRFYILRDTICITDVIDGSPSEFAGIKAGDKVLAVDDEKITKDIVSNAKVMEMLKGKPGTRVKVKVLREGKTLQKEITRGIIPINSISVSYMVNKEVGFVKIDAFSMTTVSDFKKATRALLNQGMKKLILDLRNNGGGVLPAATQIADEFLPADKLILSTKGEHTGETNYMSTSVGELEDVELAVLINENSASASEILAGAIQDHDRGVIVGRRSFGKGLVQEDMQLRDGSNLRLTIARYYTPSGRCIQKPYEDSYEEYIHDAIDRYDDGELYAVDSSLFVDSLAFKTLNKGRTVYGGGGIMPDVFVPLDTTGTSWYLSQLRYVGVFQGFAFDFIADKRQKWKSPKVYNATFNVTDALFNRFTNYAETEYEIAPSANGIKQSKALIQLLLKAEIGRQLWTENGFYTVFNTKDKEFSKALEALK